MQHRRSIWEMGSDFLREAAVLILVFGFLEKIAKSSEISLDYAENVFAISFGLFILGVIAEYRRIE